VKLSIDLSQTKQIGMLSEWSESMIRQFLTQLFVLRAKRHLQTLAAAYGWSPETTANYESQFITTEAMTPLL
jgi:hypothetical protein